MALAAALALPPAAAQEGTAYTVRVEAHEPAEAVGDTRHVPLDITVEAQGLVCPEGGTFQLAIAADAWLLAPTPNETVTAQAVPEQLTLTYPGTAGLGGSLAAEGQAQVVVRVSPVPEPGALAFGNVTARLTAIECASALPLPVGSPGASGSAEFQATYRPQDRGAPEQVMPAPFALVPGLILWAARRRAIR